MNPLRSDFELRKEFVKLAVEERQLKKALGPLLKTAGEQATASVSLLDPNTLVFDISLETTYGYISGFNQRVKSFKDFTQKFLKAIAKELYAHTEISEPQVWGTGESDYRFIELRCLSSRVHRFKARNPVEISEIILEIARDFRVNLELEGRWKT